MTQSANQLPESGVVSGLAIAQDANAALKTVQTRFYGVTDPATISGVTVLPGMEWADSGNDLLKVRNAANTAWVSNGTLSTGDFVAYQTHAATTKTTPVGADEFSIWDSISGLLRKVSFTNLKATLKSYFDSLYISTAGMRNFDINGCCRIAQDVQTKTVSATPQYGGCDQFLTSSTGTGLAGTIQQFTELTGTTYGTGHGISAYAATTGKPSFSKRYRSINVNQLNGKTVAFQAKVVHNQGNSQNWQITLGKAFALDNFGTVNSIGTCTMSVTAVPNATYTIITGTYTFGASDCSNGLQITIEPVSAATYPSGNVVVSDIQFEIGLVSTAFERRDQEYEEFMCQKYLRKSFALAVAPATALGENHAATAIAGKATTGIQIIIVDWAANPMWKAPTAVTLYNPVSANAQMYDFNAAGNCSSTAVGTSSATRLRITATGNAATAVGNLLGVGYLSDARL